MTLGRKAVLKINCLLWFVFNFKLCTPSMILPLDPLTKFKNKRVQEILFFHNNTIEVFFFFFSIFLNFQLRLNFQSYANVFTDKNGCFDLSKSISNRWNLHWC